MLCPGHSYRSKVPDLCNINTRSQYHPPATGPLQTEMAEKIQPETNMPFVTIRLPNLCAIAFFSLLLACLFSSLGQELSTLLCLHHTQHPGAPFWLSPKHHSNTNTTENKPLCCFLTRVLLVIYHMWSRSPTYMHSSSSKMQQSGGVVTAASLLYMHLLAETRALSQEVGYARTPLDPPHTCAELK